MGRISKKMRALFIVFVLIGCVLGKDKKLHKLGGLNHQKAVEHDLDLVRGMVQHLHENTMVRKGDIEEQDLQRELKEKKKKKKEISVKERLETLKALKEKLHKDNKEVEEKQKKKIVEIKRDPKDRNKEGMLNKEQLDAVRLMNNIIEKGLHKREK